MNTFYNALHIKPSSKTLPNPILLLAFNFVNVQYLVLKISIYFARKQDRILVKGCFFVVVFFCVSPQLYTVYIFFILVTGVF